MNNDAKAQLLRQLENYIPYNEQEEKDRLLIMNWIRTQEDAFLRTNNIAHITASAWVVNPSRTKVLMVYHNIYNSWSWLGGHADGETDLLSVALREVREEAGITSARPASEDIYSLESLTVDGHEKRGEYVSSHLHLNITYLIEADEDETLTVKADENSGVAWFTTEEALQKSTEPWFVERIYSKCASRDGANGHKSVPLSTEAGPSCDAGTLMCPKAPSPFHIGNHLTSTKGYLAMGKMATKLGATTFSFFTRNPRGGKAKEVDASDAAALMDYMREHDFGTLVAHAPYTMNLCSDKPDIREFAKNMLIDDLQNRMEFTPHQYYNFHPGSHVGQGPEAAIRMIAEALDEAMFPEMTTTVLLETMSGKGSEVGRTFEEIRAIIDTVKDSTHLGVCLDTCHVWDGGYDIVTDFDGVLDEFDRIIGLDRLKAIHINDSMNPCGAHKDRHEKIGQGHIGEEAFRRIVTNPRVRHLPFILETPNDDAGYAAEIAMIRSW